MKQSKLKSGKLKIGDILGYTFAIFCTICAFFPLVFTVINSLKNRNEIYNDPFGIPHIFRFDNYIKAIQMGNLLNCLKNSLFLSVVSVVVLLVIAAMASYTISRVTLKGDNINNKANNFLNLYFISGILIPIHATFIPLVRLVGFFKAGNSYVTLILIFVTFNLSMSIFLIASYMKNISMELTESAIIDGCGHFRIFWKIIFPLAAPAVATAGIVSFLNMYNDLIFSILFISKKSLYTISIGLLSFSDERMTEYGAQFAGIILVLLPMVIIYIKFQQQVVSGLSSGGVKG